MLNKATTFFSILLSVSITIGPLQCQRPSPQTWYSRFYGNNMSKSSLMNILNLGPGTINLLKQYRRFQSQEIPDMTPQPGETFDFIVIGAGIAGSAIAARLSEISQVKILLIEAGSHENIMMDIPLLAATLSLDHDINNINWKYRTKPSNKYCLGMKYNSCIWPAGKVMGGGSVLNFMIANRGTAEDYDRWAEMGSEGWAYKDVLKYFKKLETMDIPELKSNTDYHGTDGPVHITYSKFRTPIAEAFLEAGKELGYPLVDYNGENEIGFSFTQATMLNGTRMSSNRAYLHPVRDRNNLYVTVRSTVTKVLINRITKRAVGVEFIKNRRTISVFARKEVILSAGTIKSAQLLMLSGIGPARHLSELGIDVVKHAPVGENLMDHIVFTGLAWTINSSISLQFFKLMNPVNPFIMDFLLKQTGPFTIPGGIEAVSFVNSKQPKKRTGTPDIELFFASSTMKDFVFAVLLDFKNSLREEWSKYTSKYGWAVGPILLKPKSRGRIMLVANDINVKPDIIPNYFDDSDDMRTMIAGIRTGLRIGRTKAMQVFDSQLLNLTYAGMCENYEYDSDKYWECAIRAVASSTFHYSGTCKMGAREDPSAVIDPRLKVIGIHGLRVADASIMPEIISAHTSVPVYMIAEKAADMIKEEWGYL